MLGQPNFTSKTAHTTQNGMNGPTSLAMDNASGRLYVSEWPNNRILVFNSADSLANGANASDVLGQKNFIAGGEQANDLWLVSSVAKWRGGSPCQPAQERTPAEGG